jgi:hypothetical protein
LILQNFGTGFSLVHAIVKMLGGIILAVKGPVPEVASIVGVLNAENKNHDDEPSPEQFSIQILLLLFFFL